MDLVQSLCLVVFGMFAGALLMSVFFLDRGPDLENFGDEADVQHLELPSILMRQAD